MLCVVLLPPEEWPGRASAPTSVELRFVRSASELDAADAAAAEGIVAVPGCDIGALRGLLAALPRCAWLHSFSAGVDGIAPVLRETPDTLRASNARGAFTSSLAEYALAAALHFNKQVPRCMANRAAGRWERFTMNVLRGKTLGLLGYGSIARATAKLAAAFGMRIIALRRNVGGEAGEVVPEATYGYDDRAAFFGAPPAREVAPQSGAETPSSRQRVCEQAPPTSSSARCPRRARRATLWARPPRDGGAHLAPLGRYGEMRGDMGRRRTSHLAQIRPHRTPRVRLLRLCCAARTRSLHSGRAARAASERVGGASGRRGRLRGDEGVGRLHLARPRRRRRRGRSRRGAVARPHLRRRARRL